MAKNSHFDPDTLNLTKNDLLEFCDRVIKKWNKHPDQNTGNILAMQAVKTSIVWTEEEYLKSIWREIISWIFELLYENAISQGQKDNAERSTVMKKLKSKP